jgi:hypothetical protein
VTKGGRSPTGVTPAAAWTSEGAHFAVTAAGKGSGFSLERTNSLAGRHVTDRQMRLFMNLRRHHSPAIPGANAGFSTAATYRFEKDPRLPTQKKAHRERRRADPFVDVWENEVLPMLKAAPGLRPIAVFEELATRDKRTKNRAALIPINPGPSSTHRPLAGILSPVAEGSPFTASQRPPLPTTRETLRPNLARTVSELITVRPPTSSTQSARSGRCSRYRSSCRSIRATTDAFFHISENMRRALK